MSALNEYIAEGAALRSCLKKCRERSQVGPPPSARTGMYKQYMRIPSTACPKSTSYGAQT